MSLLAQRGLASSHAPLCGAARAHPLARGRCRAALRVVAFKETDEIKDWRIKEMVDKSHAYMDAVWSKGHTADADTLLDPSFVHRDLCGGWVAPPERGSRGATGVVVGVKAFKALVEEVRRQYPDFYIEVQQVAVSDTHQLFVQWVSHGTQLEAPSGARGAAPSYHNSPVSGVDVIKFNADRSRIVEVDVYRQLTADERHAVEQRCNPNPLELHLARLHWEPNESRPH